MNMLSTANLKDATISGGLPEIVLDLSRLLSRVLHATPTGIDRVEMAYARGLLNITEGRLAFAAVNPAGIYGRLPLPAVADFLDETERLWNGGQHKSRPALYIRAARKLLQLLPRRVPERSGNARRVYLLASPHHLDRPDLLGRILQREQARFACLVHDLIPIEYPEYARPGGADRHRKRMDTLGRYADVLITNSKATRDSLTAYLAPAGRVPPIQVAHLGTHVTDAGKAKAPNDIPYFVCVGTIEPRKNHIMLLKIWRRMAEEALQQGEPAPKLVLIGRRGWENENVVDMLERSPLLKDLVIEANGMADNHALDLIRGARALLMPSFAEGYGMPIAEALELRIPVICSDLPALREVGRNVPEYLDPLDGLGWMQAIRDYSVANAPRRRAQIARMRNWRAPTWGDHLNLVVNCCGALAA